MAAETAAAKAEVLMSDLLSSPAPIRSVPLEVLIEHRSSGAVIRLSGECDPTNVAELEQATGLLGSKVRMILIAVAELHFCADCGFQTLLDANKKARAVGTEFIVQSPSSFFEKTLSGRQGESHPPAPTDPGGCGRDRPFGWPVGCKRRNAALTSDAANVPGSSA